MFVTVPLPPTDVRLNLEFDNGIPNINALWMVSYKEVVLLCGEIFFNQVSVDICLVS